jgi:hypothetical protein
MKIFKYEDETILCCSDMCNNYSDGFFSKLITSVILFLIAVSIMIPKRQENDKSSGFVIMFCEFVSIYFVFVMSMSEIQANLIKDIQRINAQPVSCHVLVKIRFNKSSGEDNDYWSIQFRHDLLDKDISTSVDYQKDIATFFYFGERVEQSEKTMTLTCCKSEPKYYYLSAL